MAVDLDELLAFTTVKLVIVRDKYLGCFRLTMILAILIYIIGFVLIKDRGYMITEVPVGAMQSSLKKPPYLQTVGNYTYCKDYVPPAGSDEGHSVTEAYALDCLILDEYDILFPPEQTSAMFLTTRMSDEEQTKSCVDGSKSGKENRAWMGYGSKSISGCGTVKYTPKNDQPEYFYAAGIEQYTIRLLHFMQARRFYVDSDYDDRYSRSNADMKGKLEDIHGNVLQSFSNQAGDIFTVGTLLKAADVELDDVMDMKDNDEKEPMRYTGIVLFLQIEYHGTGGDPEYTYTVTRIKGSEYKIMQNIYVDEKTRILRNRHGIKIVIGFTGQLGKFDFQTMLIQLVAGLGLLTVATLLTDLAISYCSNTSEVLNEYKYSKTEKREDLVGKMSGRKSSASGGGRGNGNANADDSTSNKKSISPLPSRERQFYATSNKFSGSKKAKDNDIETGVDDDDIKIEDSGMVVVKSDVESATHTSPYQHSPKYDPSKYAGVRRNVQVHKANSDISHASPDSRANSDQDPSGPPELQL